MAIDMNDDIFQDFLVEAGELLENLNEQLVVLEQQPDDTEMLNAIFRAFHTIKGGAGFLSLSALVNLCHVAEDVFNVLRQGERKVDADLIDIILKSLDVLNAMFDDLRNGQEPQAASPELIDGLHAFASPVSTEDAVKTEAVSEVAPVNDSDDSITEDEFDALLDQMHGSDVTEKVQAAATDEITDEEFENLLDDLHGKKPVPENNVATPVATDKTEQKIKPVSNNISQPVKAEATVRVATKRLDDIMNLVGELVLVRNRLTTLKSVMKEDNVAKAISNLELVTSDLQAAVMKTRMQPVKKLFSRFPRVVRDLARSLNKEVRLELNGEETDLDKNLVEALADPLIHLVRNSVDHGIETPEQRVAAGKPREGVLTLTAGQEGDQIMLMIQDDGAGMDPDVLRGIAVKKGMMDEETAQRLSDFEVYNLIFAPGFSTKTEISDVSGRGVGMDVVKTRINELNGDVEIDSERGKGTSILIRLPLTLAILPTLMVVLGKQRFALPLAIVSEAFKLESAKINEVDGQEMILVREKPLPLFRLSSWLGGEPSVASTDHVVLVQMGTRRFGFVVNQLIGQEEVVIKPLGELLHGLPGFAGATITGDGNIALILDLQGLLSTYARQF